MIVQMEFKATSQQIGTTPEPPEGEGWMLGGSSGLPLASLVYHYWQRPVKYKRKVCSRCNAMAFKNGKCVGCGTALKD